MRFNSLGQIATDDRGAAVCGWLEDAVVGPYQRDTGGDKWQMVTRTGTTVTPLPGVVGGCNAVASADGQWMRRLDSANPKLFGSHPWTPPDGFVGDMDGDTAITLDDTNRWLSIFVAGAKVSEYRRGSAFGGLRLKGSIASWVEFPNPPIIAFPGPYVVARDVILNTPIPVQVIGAAQYTPVVFRHSTGDWAIYQTDELGGVCHRVDDATQGYIFGVPQSIYDPDVLPTDTGCTIGWSVDAGQFQTQTLEITELGAGMVPLTIAPPVVDNFGPVSAPVPDGTEISDLAAYIVGAPSLWPRDGTHPMHQVIAGPLIHQCKFSAQAAPLRDRYETWGLDAEWVHHVEDASPDVPYAFTNTQWFPRRMKVGLAHVHQSDRDDAVFRERGTCGEVNRVGFHDRTWVEDAWDRFDCGPELGIRRVVAVVWDNTDGVYAHDRGIEVNWFGEGVGWLRWEYHRSDIVMASGTPVFSDASRVHRSDFYRVTGQPWTPKLTGCAPPMTPDTPVGLRKPEVTVTNWTLNEMKSGREFAFIDRENPGFGARVWTEDGSMFASFSNPVGFGRTHASRPIKACPVVPVPPVPPTPPIPPGPIPAPDMHAWPKLGVFYQQGLCNPACDPALFAALNRDAGGNVTVVWAFDAWAIGANGQGQYSGFVPWRRDADGVFDLTIRNGQYFDRLNSYVRAQNAAGATVQIVIAELYGWSERKSGGLWVPNQNLGPFRRNKNGVMWGHPDDPTLFGMPDGTMQQWIAWTCEAVKGLAVGFIAGNEFPEKGSNARIAAELQKHFTTDWRPNITVNRNEDTSGQYFNMRIGKTLDNNQWPGVQFDRIEYHGKGTLGYLDEVHEEEPDTRPKTFRQLFDQPWPEGTVDPKRVIMSSDGCRVNSTIECYDWPVLADVARDHLGRGFSFLHQSKCKMRVFLENRLDLRADFETAWLLSLRS